MPSFSHQVHNGPMVFPALKVVNGEIDELSSTPKGTILELFWPSLCQACHRLISSPCFSLTSCRQNHGSTMSTAVSLRPELRITADQLHLSQTTQHSLFC
jgi:hypothetical protein